MRWALGTTATAVAATIMFMAFPPITQQTQRAGLVVEVNANDTLTVEAASKVNPVIVEIERTLDKTMMKAEFSDIPLADVFIAIGDKIDYDLVLNPMSQIDPGTTINLSIRHREISARAVLEMALSQLGDGAGYQIRDGFILITEMRLAIEPRVFDCRQLLADAAKNALENAPRRAPFEGDPAVGFGIPETPADALIDVITGTIQPDSWANNGGYASCHHFNGLLIVKHHQQVQREVERLLNLLHIGENSAAKK